MENGKLEYKDSTRCTDCAEKFIRDRQRTADCGLFLGEVPLKPLSSLSLNYFFSAGCEIIGQNMATVRLCCAAALRLPSDFFTNSHVHGFNDRMSLEFRAIPKSLRCTFIKSRLSEIRCLLSAVDSSNRPREFPEPLFHHLLSSFICGKSLLILYLGQLNLRHICTSHVHM